MPTPMEEEALRGLQEYLRAAIDRIRPSAARRDAPQAPQRPTEDTREGAARG
jgi:hypothetical protein